MPKTKKPLVINFAVTITATEQVRDFIQDALEECDPEGISIQNMVKNAIEARLFAQDDSLLKHVKVRVI